MYQPPGPVNDCPLPQTSVSETSEIKIMTINTHSTLHQHWIELLAFLTLYNPDVLVVTETGLTPSKAQRLCHIPHYAILHVTPKGDKKAKDSKYKRGISMIVRDKWLPFLSPSLDRDVDISEELSAIHIAIRTEKPIHIIGIYGISSGDAKYWDNMKAWLLDQPYNGNAKRLPKKAYCVVIGDMNQAPNETWDRRKIESARSPPRPPPQSFTQMLAQKLLIDAWREKHPIPERDYTFRPLREDPNEEVGQSRIDLALISPNLVKHIVECEIREKPSLLTPDHNPLELCLRLRTPIPNMPPNEPVIPETTIDTIDLEDLASAESRKNFQRAVELAVKEITKMPPLTTYEALMSIITNALQTHIKTNRKILNKQRTVHEPDKYERTYGHADRVASSAYHILEAVKNGQPLQHTDAMLKLARNAPSGYEIRPPPDTNSFEEANEWFHEVGVVLKRLCEFLVQRETQTKSARILEAIERSDGNAHCNLKRFFQVVGIKGKSMKRQTLVINEVDPTQTRLPEYEDTSTPEKHNEAIRKWFQRGFKARKREPIPEKPWLTQHFRKQRLEAEKAYKGELMEPISLETLDDVLRCIPNGKAAGPDGVLSEVIRALPTNARKLLADLFTAFLESQSTPDSWRHCRIYTIHKSGDAARCSNYRPISLQSVVYKTFASILTRRLTKHVEKHSLLSNAQGGFRANRTCAEKIDLLSQLVKRHKAKGMESHVLFADIKKAYDSVPIDALLGTLADHRLDPNFIALIQNIYDRNTADVITIHGTTDPFKVERGVKQGDPLSCMLFNLFIEPALDWIQQAQKSPLENIMAFADDMSIITTDIESLQHKVDMLQTYLHANGLELGVSADKSKTVYMTNNEQSNLTICKVRHAPQNNGDILLQKLHERTALPKMTGRESYRYLGVRWNIELNFEGHLSSAEGKLKAICMRLQNAHYTRMQTVMIINRIIVPALTYGFEITKPTKTRVCDWDDAIARVINRKARMYHFASRTLHHMPKTELGEGLASFELARKLALARNALERGLNSHDSELATIHQENFHRLKTAKGLGLGIEHELDISIRQNLAKDPNLPPTSLLRAFNKQTVSTLSSAGIRDINDLLDTDGNISEPARRNQSIKEIVQNLVVPGTNRATALLLARYNHEGLTKHGISSNQTMVTIFTDGSRSDATAGIGVHRPDGPSYGKPAPAHIHIAEIEAHALLEAAGIHDPTKNSLIITDSEVNVKRFEKLAKTGTLPRNTPLEAREALHTLVNITKEKNKAGTRLQIVPILSHTLDQGYFTAEEKKRRKEINRKRFGELTKNYVRGNKVADKRATEGANKTNKTPITPESAYMPKYLPYDPNTRTLISDVPKYLKRKYFAENRAKLKKESERYDWMSGDISWSYSALLGQSTDPALNKIQNFAIRARRRLLHDKQTQLSRQDLPHWKDRYRTRIQDDKCNTCEEVETRFHFCECKTHNERRKTTTQNVLTIINASTTKEITEIPIFWAHEQHHESIPADHAEHADLWRKVESLPTERAAMGIIPLSFTQFISTLPWAEDTNFINIFKEIQIEIVQGFFDCWKARCIGCFGNTSQERAARTSDKIQLRTQRRTERTQRKQIRRRRYENSQKRQDGSPRSKRHKPLRTARPDEEPPP